MLRLITVSALIGCIIAASVSQKARVPMLDGRIVGGEVIDITEAPYQISLRSRSEYCPTCQFSHICGGSIYDSLTVITAAHCVVNSKPSTKVIVAGSNNRNGGDGVLIPVKEIIVHENYDPRQIDNDVALLILENEIPINKYNMKGIELNDAPVDEGVLSFITGWGTTSSGGMSSNYLMGVRVPIVSNKKCDDAYGTITEQMLCAGMPEGGKDACQGDSGGPLVVKNKLAGIVSWGRGCALAGYPGVYANVSALKPWIDANLPKYVSKRIQG